MTNNTPNHTAAHSGSNPNSVAMPTTTGAKTGTVITIINTKYKTNGATNISSANKTGLFVGIPGIGGKPMPGKKAYAGSGILAAIYEVSKMF